MSAQNIRSIQKSHQEPKMKTHQLNFILTRHKLFHERQPNVRNKSVRGMKQSDCTVQTSDTTESKDNFIKPNGEKKIKISGKCKTYVVCKNFQVVNFVIPIIQ